jgi:hypothetical protein
MDSAEMRMHCPHAVALGPARLSGYRFAFTTFAQHREGGVADIVRIDPKDPQLDYEARAPGANEPYPLTPVWGVLWDVPVGELDSLDRKEGYVPGKPEAECVYVHTPVQVLLHGKEVNHVYDAFAFTVASKFGHVPPSEHYLDLILRGAAEHGLPQEYLRGVVRVGRWSRLPNEAGETLDWL